MKAPKFFFLTAATLMMFSVVSFAQTAKTSTAESLTGIQSWLANAITKNGTYNIGSNVVRIKDVKFDGCKMSYQQFNIVLFDVSSDAGRSVVVTIDLKDIDQKRLALKPYTPYPAVSSTGPMQKMSIYPLGDKDSFRLAGYGKDLDWARWGLKTGVTMVVKYGVAEAIKDNLLKAAALCQAEK